MLSIVLAVMACFALAITAAIVGVLRRCFGDQRTDAAGGAAIILLMCYIAVGSCYAVYVAVNSVVPNAEIEYDSREFLR